MKTTGYSLLCIFLWMLFLAVPPALAAEQWETAIIPVDELTPIAADISGDTIVFTAAIGDPVNQSNPRVLCLYPISSGNLTQVAVSVPPMSLTGAQISGTTFVWFEQPALIPNVTGGPDRIVISTIPQNTPQIIHTGDGAEWPKISGKRIIWSGNVNESEFIQGIYTYDTTEGTTSLLPDVTVFDAASTVLNGELIAYQDGLSMDLILYNIATGNKTIVSQEIRTDSSATNIDSFAFSGNYIVFITRTIGLEKDNRGETEALFLYTIDNGTTRLINPVTGTFVTALSNEEKTATFDSPFTDGRRIGWILFTGIDRSTIIVLDPESGEVSTLPVESFVAFPSMDNSYIVFTADGFATNNSLVLATELSGQKPLNGSPGPTNIPGFTLCAALSACGVAGIISRMKRG